MQLSIRSPIVLDILALLISFVSFFLPQIASPTLQGVIRLLLLCRIFRDYLLWKLLLGLFSNDIRRIFNRSRARDKDSNLDITYISCKFRMNRWWVARIIAMSWPGSKWESVWRNNISDVEHYLNEKHGGHYWVYGKRLFLSTYRLNLCAEGEYKERKKYYFGGRYTHYCVQDHNPCSLAQLRAIIYECTEWLSQDPLNVIAIHCKGGKGRTGMVVASLLLRQCIQQCPDSALDFFASKRTSRDIINGGKVKPQRVSSGR